MTTDKAKEIFEGIKGYENTMDLIENHSVSVQDACAIGINAIEEVNRYKKAIEEIKAEIDENVQECKSPLVHDLRWNGRFEAFKESLEIIDKYIKGVET